MLMVGVVNSSGEPDGNWSCKELVLQEGVRLCIITM